MNISRLVELGMESQSLEMLKKEDCNQPGFHRETLSQNKIKNNRLLRSESAWENSYKNIQPGQLLPELQGQRKLISVFFKSIVTPGGGRRTQWPERSKGGHFSVWKWSHPYTNEGYRHRMCTYVRPHCVCILLDVNSASKLNPHISVVSFDKTRQAVDPAWSQVAGLTHVPFHHNPHCAVTSSPSCPFLPVSAARLALSCLHPRTLAHPLGCESWLKHNSSHWPSLPGPADPIWIVFLPGIWKEDAFLHKEPTSQWGKKPPQSYPK